MAEQPEVFFGGGENKATILGRYASELQSRLRAVDGTDFVELRGPRVGAATHHGTGCTFSAALTAALAKGHPLPDAARIAKHHVHDVLVALG